MKKKLVAIICASMLAFVGCGGTSSVSIDIDDSGDQSVEKNDDSKNNDEDTEDKSEESEESEDLEESASIADRITDTLENLDEVVMVIDGVEITKDLYMLYDYTTTQNFYAMTMYYSFDEISEGLTEEEYIETRIQETLKSIVATVKYAEDNNITITEEEQLEIDNATIAFIDDLPEAVISQLGFNTENLSPYMSESFIHSKVYDLISTQYDLDDEAYQTYYSDNSQAIAMDYALLHLNSILVDDPLMAEEVNSRARAGEDFNNLFYEYDISTLTPELEETGALSIAQGQFLNTFMITEAITAGEILGPLEMNGSYFVFLVEDVEIPANEDLDEIVLSIFASNAEIEYAEGVIMEMINNLNIEINDDVLSNIESFYQY